MYLIYLNESSLELHLKQCKNKKDDLPKFVNQFECPICKKKMAKMTILRAHIKMQHDPNRQKCKCIQCKRIFPSESSFEDHLQRCTNRKGITADDSSCNIILKV